MQVKNMINSNNNTVSNQFIIENNREIEFQSYKSSICGYNLDTGKLTLNGEMWDYSNTTRKYFKQFINEETSFTYEDKKQWLKEIQENDNIEVL